MMAIRHWSPQALDALFGVVQDATANPKARRKAALKIAEFLLPKDANKAKVIPDELKRNLSQLEGDGFEMYRDHPFVDELQAPDGNFYPRHSKLRPAERPPRMGLARNAGAIGCSGGTGSQDETVCTAGANTINK